MTTRISKIMIFAMLASCGSRDQQKSKDGSGTKEETATVERPGKDPRSIGGEKSRFQLEIDRASGEIRQSDNPILGYWIGAFGPNMINLTLSNIDGNKISGYSVCAGNFRPVSGTVEGMEQGVKIVLNEPGDDRYDGKFEFTINTDHTLLEGKWTPFRQHGNQAKTYRLRKRGFTYDPLAGEYKETSRRRLKESEVENLKEETLRIMRNEIYARHGYSFKEKDMRKYFEQKSWYMPVGVDIRDQLTDIEADNIDLIYAYEEYYGINYDSYGR